MVRNRWLTKRAVLATLAVVVWAPGCLLAGWWQATVAMSGNTLSYLYAVEWPAFAVFGVFVWWHLVHDDPDTVGARGVARLRAAAAARAAGGGAARDAAAPVAAAPVRHAVAGRVEVGVAGGARVAGEPGAGTDADADEELREYNEYLASLAGRPKTWRQR
jgi:hypothetical protein